MMKLSYAFRPGHISAVYHGAIFLLLLLPRVQGLGIRNMLTNAAHQQNEDKDPREFMRFVSNDCPDAMAACMARHPPGTLSYEGWSSLLNKLSGDDPSGNDPDSAIARLRNIVDMASRLGSAQEIYQQVLNDLENDEVATMLQTLADNLEQGVSQGQVHELDLAVTFTFLFSKTQELLIVPIVGPVLAILFNVLAFPISIPTYTILFGTVIKTYKLVCLFTFQKQDCPLPDFSGLSPSSSSNETASSSSNIGETQSSSSSPDPDVCQAELLSCELEAFLAETIPFLLKEAFIEAGTV